MTSSVIGQLPIATRSHSSIHRQRRGCLTKAIQFTAHTPQVESLPTPVRQRGLHSPDQEEVARSHEWARQLGQRRSICSSKRCRGCARSRSPPPPAPPPSSRGTPTTGKAASGSRARSPPQPPPRSSRRTTSSDSLGWRRTRLRFSRRDTRSTNGPPPGSSASASATEGYTPKPGSSSAPRAACPRRTSATCQNFRTARGPWSGPTCGRWSPPSSRLGPWNTS